MKRFILERSQALGLVAMFNEIGYVKRAKALACCSSHILYAVNADQRSVVGMHRCRCAFCPVCNKIRGQLIGAHLRRAMSEPEFVGVKFLLVTLAMRNCKAADLSSEIDHLLGSFKKLINPRGAFGSRFLGVFRSLEITYNSERDDYHPHLHLLVAAPPDYSPSSRFYLRQDKLVKTWRRAFKVDYDPTAHISLVRADDDNNRTLRTADGVSVGLKKAVREVTKYVTKFGEIPNPQVLRVLFDATFHRRLISFSGVFKQVLSGLASEFDQERDEYRAKRDDLIADPATAYELVRPLRVGSCTIQEIVSVPDYATGVLHI